MAFIPAKDRAQLIAGECLVWIKNNRCSVLRSLDVGLNNATRNEDSELVRSYIAIVKQMAPHLSKEACYLLKRSGYQGTLWEGELDKMNRQLDSLLDGWTPPNVSDSGGPSS